MLNLMGKTVLNHVIERCNLIVGIDEVVVATTINNEDDQIVSECRRNHVKYFRGSEKDVLQRYYMAARELKADVIIRITSDCPLLDPTVSNQLIQTFIADGCYEYGEIVGFPRGLDTEIFTMQALEQAYTEAVEDYEREHVTPYLYSEDNQFRILRLHNEMELSNHRWTLDTAEDWQLISRIYEKLYTPGQIIHYPEVLSLIQCQPSLLEINSHVIQKKLGE